MPLQNYKELALWQKSFHLSEIIDKVRTGFPNGYNSDLILNIKRLAKDVPGCIAAAGVHDSLKEGLSCLYSAYSSNCEFVAEMLRAKEKGELDEIISEYFLSEINEVNRLLEATILDLEKQTANEPGSKI